MVSPIARILMGSRVVLLCVASAALLAEGSPPSPPATPLARFAVHAGDSTRVDTPVSASLAGLPIHRAGEATALFEVVGDKRIPVVSQVDTEKRKASMTTRLPPHSCPLAERRRDRGSASG